MPAMTCSAVLVSTRIGIPEQEAGDILLVLLFFFNENTHVTNV
jgi:hypothetical protein